MVRDRGSRLLSALDDAERSELLGVLLRRHPELREDAERLARERLAAPDQEGLVGEVAVGELAEEVRAVLREHDLPVPDLPEPGSGGK